MHKYNYLNTILIFYLFCMAMTATNFVVMQYNNYDLFIFFIHNNLIEIKFNYYIIIFILFILHIVEREGVLYILVGSSQF